MLTLHIDNNFSHRKATFRLEIYKSHKELVEKNKFPNSYMAFYEIPAKGKRLGILHLPKSASLWTVVHESMHLAMHYKRMKKCHEEEAVMVGEAVAKYTWAKIKEKSKNKNG